METILVTGGAGYLGSLLIPRLLHKGYRVIGLDALYFGPGPISGFRLHDRFRFVKADIREMDRHKNLLRGVDNVIHLAALSNDPSCDIDSRLAVDINYQSTVECADLCKQAGVKRFLFASSCSVYGWRGSEILTEQEKSNPVSVYAQTKIDSENYLRGIADQHFTPVILRMATLFGCSPRMRFDLAINIMTLCAIRDGRIQISGGGKQWRPFVHILDAADAFIHLLEYPVKERSEVFNIGANENNHSILELAGIVQAGLPSTKLAYLDDDRDKRSYRVCFDKIEGTGFKAATSIQTGIEEIAQLINNNSVNFSHPLFYNIQTMKNILETREALVAE